MTYTLKRNPNNTNGQPFQPYFFILDGQGTVQYRIDKTERGRAADAMFTIYRCTDGHCHGQWLTKVTLHGVCGLERTKSVARGLCQGLPITFDVYIGRNQPREVREYDPVTNAVSAVGTFDPPPSQPYGVHVDWDAGGLQERQRRARHVGGETE